VLLMTVRAITWVGLAVRVLPLPAAPRLNGKAE
jgi:hypothetical protein